MKPPLALLVGLALGASLSPARADGPFAPWTIKPEKIWLVELTVEQAWRTDDLTSYRWSRADAFDPTTAGGVEPGSSIQPLATSRATLDLRGSWQPIRDLQVALFGGLTPSTRYAFKTGQTDPILPFAKDYVIEPGWGVRLGGQVEGVVRRFGPLVVAPFAGSSWTVEQGGKITSEDPSGNLGVPGPRPGGLAGWIDGSDYLSSLQVTGGVVAGWEIPPWSAPYVGVRADWGWTRLTRRTSINDALGLRTFVHEDLAWKPRLPFGLIVGTGTLGQMYWPLSVEVHLLDEWAAAVSYEVLF